MISRLATTLVTAFALVPLLFVSPARASDATDRLLYFSAPWCAACKPELRQLQSALEQKWGAAWKGFDPTLYVETGATPNVPPTQEIAEAHAAELGTAFRPKPDPWRWTTFKQYFPAGPMVLPAAVILRADGTVKKTFLGAAAGWQPIAAEVGSPPPAPAEREEYLVGEMRTLRPTGELLASHVYLVKRSVRPTDGYVRVETTQLGDDGHASDHVVTMKVSGTAMTLSDPDGTYQGTGSWTGEPWRWKSWRYDVTWADGSGGVSGEDEATATHIRISKRYRDRAGTTVRLAIGELAFVTARTYEILRKKIVP